MIKSKRKFIDASTRAEEIVQTLQIREPFEILIQDITVERGAFVKEGLLEGSEARLIRRGSIGIITVSNNIKSEGRKRFAIAHELGHFELHMNSQLMFCDEEDMLIWNEAETQEFEANKFAASILMPRQIFSKHIEKGQPKLDNIKTLSSNFRTSLTATALRYVTLSPEPCAIVLTADENIKWYRKSSCFEYHVKVGDKLSPIISPDDSEDAEVFSSPIRVPASAWLAGIKDDAAMIFEQSIELKRYNIMLSLLWIDSDFH